jgi:hypothetical protein
VIYALSAEENRAGQAVPQLPNSPLLPSSVLDLCPESLWGSSGRWRATRSFLDAPGRDCQIFSGEYESFTSTPAKGFNLACSPYGPIECVRSPYGQRFREAERII